jgi:hypothetical protein
VIASGRMLAYMREHGGLLFVWPEPSWGPRSTLVMLQASLDPPADALDYARVDLDEFVLFLHPNLGRPHRLGLKLRGRKSPVIRAFWNGLPYVA